MAKVLDMPKLSPTMEEGQLASWHKKEGDAVEVDDLLAEVETDKATMEFRSFDKGTILKILAPPGSMVKLGQAVAILGTPGEDISGLVPTGGVAPAGAATEGDTSAADASKRETAPESAPTVGRGDAARDAATKTGAEGDRKEDAPDAARASGPDPANAAKSASSAAAPPAANGRVRASPHVRKLARERDLDLTSVRGTGPHGRIIARDLVNAPGRKPAPSPASRGAQPSGRRPDERRPLSMMRKTIARRLTESKTTVPHFYLTIDVDARALHDLREQIVDDLAAAAKDEKPEKISINDLLVKACALALRRVPECNASYTADALVLYGRVDISVAVAVPDGLVTPVVRDADTKSVLAIAREVRDLAGRAKDKKLKPEEMADGTFSISNLGMFGIDSFSAVINPPEGAILAVGRVRDEPMVDGDRVVPGKRLAMTLSCDHRVIDGATGARFLAELRKLLERPTQILVA